MKVIFRNRRRGISWKTYHKSIYLLPTIEISRFKNNDIIYSCQFMWLWFNIEFYKRVRLENDR